MYDFYNSIENFLFYSYDPYFRRIIGLRAKFWIQEGSKQVFWHTKIYIPVIRATIWKVQNGKKMSMVDYNNTCPKGFGLKLAKLGLKTPLKK